ncbi:MAG: ABC transporter permease [Chloroflexota bacterium]|nr:ABC transporter permease [Chloroflexota bacterium]
MEAIAARVVIRAPGQAWHFLRRWPVIPGVFITVLTLFAIFPNLIAPYNPYDGDLAQARIPPFGFREGSLKHIFGTDHVGRDIFSRVVYGARISLRIAGSAIGAGLLLGTTVGLVSGYFGSWVDEFFMRLIDAISAVPFILVGLVAAIVFGPKESTVLGVMVFGAWGMGARNVRAETLSLKTRDYVALAKVAGASHLRIVLRHLLPGVVNTVMVIATLSIGGIIMGEAFLSYMGAGIPSPTPAWGLMTAEGKDFIAEAWWNSFFPGLAIFITVMSFNFLGDWTRDRLDPRLRQL